MPADQRNPFLYDLGLAQEATNTCSRGINACLPQHDLGPWTDFCDSINVPHSSDTFKTPVPPPSVLYPIPEVPRPMSGASWHGIERPFAVGKGIQQLVDAGPPPQAFGI